MTLHIFIVDPDAGAACATCAFVRHLVPTADVVCAETPSRAWSAAQRTPPDLLVIDLTPFGPSGPLLIELCKETWPLCRVVVIDSARATQLRMQRCRGDVYLEKLAAPARVRAALAGQIRAIGAIGAGHAAA